MEPIVGFGAQGCRKHGPCNWQKRERLLQYQLPQHHHRHPQCGGDSSSERQQQRRWEEKVGGWMWWWVGVQQLEQCDASTPAEYVNKTVE